MNDTAGDGPMNSAAGGGHLDTVRLSGTGSGSG